MKPNIKHVIFIVGPTAIGKTKLSIELAKTFNTEIISFDSRQFYKELKIGTAPPNKTELQEVKHHFIHHLSINETYNSGEFEADAIRIIAKIHKYNDIVIAVGGSGLYLDAICKGFDNIPKTSPKTRDKINSEYKKNGFEWLQKKVINIDPKSYTKDNANNPHRLLRALEIFTETGQRLSSFKSNSKKVRPFKITKIGLNIRRNLLYEQINNRVDIMIENDLLSEVASLINYKKNNALNTVGYKEIFSYLKDECTLQEAIDEIKKNTRRFAKRQLTWFRKDKEINWFEPTQLTEIKKLILKLKPCQ